MNAHNTIHNPARLSADELALVSGGVEKQQLYPRKFGDVDYLLYVDGVLIGTVYGPPASIEPSVGGSGNPGPIVIGRIP